MIVPRSWHMCSKSHVAAAQSCRLQRLPAAQQRSSYLPACALKLVHFALLIIVATGPTQMLWMLILHQALHQGRACCVALHCVLYPALKEAGISKANAVDARLQLLRQQKYISQG